MASSLLHPLDSVIQKVSKNSFWLIGVTILQFAIFAPLLHYTKQIEQEFGAQTPDVLFGYNPRQFQTILETWGIAGCQAYVRIAVLDLLYMPAYSILLGALLYRSCRRARWQLDQATWIPQVCFTMFCSDLVETTFQLYSCMVYPEHFPPPVYMIAIGDLANKLKWVSIGIAGLLIFTAAIIKAYFWPIMFTANAAEERREKGDEKAAAGKKDKKK